MIDEERLWSAVLHRDAELDGQFVYGVRSTGIFCRPTCPSRRPDRAGVRFFGTPIEAQEAGFRPCRRCTPERAPEEPHLDLVQRVCRRLEESIDGAPNLDAIAAEVGLSPAHLLRVFKRIVGVTPRQYAAARRSERFKSELRAVGTVTEAVYNAGFGASSTAYTAVGEELGMSPVRYKDFGAGTRIRYTVVPCPLGWLLVGATDRGVCAVRLGDAPRPLEDGLRAEFALAEVGRDDAALGEWVRLIVAYLEGREPHIDLPLDVRATAFQRRVWDALRTIPHGSTRTYSEVAAGIGQPAAVRAVASACAANPVALVIPCHRVIRSDGLLGGYRWGLARKQTLLDQEAGTSSVARRAKLLEQEAQVADRAPVAMEAGR